MVDMKSEYGYDIGFYLQGQVSLISQTVHYVAYIQA